ncbi:cytochrome ubiquinol oxidase subunit I [Kaistia dalseonensis]|uniref:Cytochrome d ubiquinol oxidase subunit I n=1 Tax=Kaistia dalseonensis TaxID=410840 RepID=A0ABU0H7E9_9HYPH|nr:cytochrome ubiquinol oxidase subunit I [Kaistia dalseonensis]MCX5495602.1 cytochrome ubiquinol oxidase subunit I [Kaistia dalseonensis]MDQ0438195.1 cytochrome d ubiquinol oxidase subunit I [Kaistia dalseonensis]
MDLTPLLLSRIQFAFTISFHIIFPAFTIGLAAWLTFLEACGMITGERIYRRLSDFWLKIFAVAFGLGVVSGIVMAFQFGTNWSELARRTGAIQGPLLGYESFTAFALEAAFFGVLMFGRDRVPPIAYLLACLMVSLGTSLSAFWIMVNNSWMQYPTGYSLGANGIFVPTDWSAIIFSPAVWTRFPHMVLAAYVTSAFCVAATGAWYMLRGKAVQEGRAMAVMGLRLAAILVPVQLGFGHLVGDFVHDKQPAKFAAIEGRWNNEQPASEILIAWPDPKNERNLFEIAVPYLGSIIGSMNLTSMEQGIKSFPPADRPPVAIPFFSFRIMVGCGLLMLALSWFGTWLSFSERILKAKVFLIATSLSFPLGFIATLTGWFTAEVGRQPWVIYGQLRTADAVTPSLTSTEVAITLTLLAVIYAVIFGFGVLYIYRLLRAGPIPNADISLGGTNPKRPLSLPGASPGVTGAAGIGE